MDDTENAAGAGRRRSRLHAVALGLVAALILAVAAFGWQVHKQRAAAAAAARAAPPVPSDPQQLRAEALNLMTARRYQEALAAVDRALTLDPAMSGLQAIRGDAWLLLGDAEKAVTAYKSEPDETARLTGLAMGEYRLGHVEQAQAALDALVARDGDASLYGQARVRAQWGDLDLALAALERAVAMGDSDRDRLGNDPMLDPLRADPRFKSLQAHLISPG